MKSNCLIPDTLFIEACPLEFGRLTDRMDDVIFNIRALQVGITAVINAGDNAVFIDEFLFRLLLCLTPRPVSGESNYIHGAKAEKDPGEAYGSVGL